MPRRSRPNSAAMPLSVTASGPNVALEMVLAGGFAGSVVLLSPSFSAEDESKFLPILDRLTIVLGHLPYVLMLKMTAPMMRRSLPATRRDPLGAELERTDPPIAPFPPRPVPPASSATRAQSRETARAGRPRS